MLQVVENHWSIIDISAWVGYGGDGGIVPWSMVDWIREASFCTLDWPDIEP